MSKKIISLLTVCLMLVSISSPAVAADNASVKPTVEDILNEYHKSSFESQFKESADAEITYTNRSGVSGKTLEQETVDALTVAGYEAYNITSEQYSDLEASLQTDFSAMGLDPEESYIVVISGDDSDSSNSTRAYGDNQITPLPNPNEGGTRFEYTYSGKTYYLRYITVTSASNSNYAKVSQRSILPQIQSTNILQNALNAAVSMVVDSLAEELYLGTLASICGLELFDFGTSNVTTAFQLIDMYGSSNWTRVFTQVWSDATSEWITQLHVEYAVNLTSMGGQYYDRSTSSYCPVPTDAVSTTVYSPHYNDMTWRKEQAVIGFRSGITYYDFTGDIDFKYKDEVIFTNYENF